jgi:hypothetical protein
MNVDILELSNDDNILTEIQNEKHNMDTCNFSEISEIPELSDVSDISDYENDENDDNDENDIIDEINVNNSINNNSNVISVDSNINDIDIENIDHDIENIDEDIDYDIFFTPLLNQKLKTYFIYTNTNNEIEKINQSTIDITDDTITKSLLLSLIKKNKKINNIKYNLSSILVYNIHIGPSEIYNFIKNPKDYKCFYNLKKIESFQLKPTIEFLQTYNGLYFIYYDIENNKLHNNDHDNKKLINNIKNNTTKDNTIKDNTTKDNNKKFNNTRRIIIMPNNKKTRINKKIKIK